MKLFWCALVLLFLNGVSVAQPTDFEHIDFSKADSVADSYKGETLKNLPELALHLTEGLNTDIERFRSIYMWVCQNVSNDYRLYLKNKKKRNKFEDDSLKLEAWNDQFKTKLFNKLRRRKKTICSGYSYLLSELSKLANIECRMINGFGRTSTTSLSDLNSTNHSWNAVKLNEKWYLCDPTWASGIVDTYNHEFTIDYIDGLFLTEPSFFSVSHFPLDSKWTLIGDKAPKFQAFLNHPIIYRTAFDVIKVIKKPNIMHSNLKVYEIIGFEYELLEKTQLKNITLKIDNGYSIFSSTPHNISLSDNNILSFGYQFKKPGFYDVHFIFGDDLIATYTVEVIP